MKNLQLFLFFILFTSLINAQWEPANGPWTGNAKCFTKSGNNILAGTAGDGIYVSANNGKNWALGSLVGLSNHIVNCFLNNGADIYAGTEGGIFLSVDNGSHWFAVNTGLYNTNINSMVLVGSNIYAATDGGIFLTTDYGASWNSVNGNLPTNNVKALLIKDNFVFAATESGIFKSTDWGNWTSSNFGLISQDVNALFLDGSVIYAGTEYSSGADCVYRSTNNGGTWVSAGLTDLSAYSFIMFNQNMYAATSSGIFLTPDGGNYWTAELGNTRKHITSFIVSGENIIAGCTEGILVSSNGGSVWDMRGYLNVYINNMAALDDELWATASSPDGRSHYIFTSTNNGDSWIIRNPWWINSTYSFTSIKAVASKIYVAYLDGHLTLTGIIQSTNKGIDWEGNLNFHNRSIMCIDANDTLMIFGFYKSNNDYGFCSFDMTYGWGCYNEGVNSVLIKDKYVFASTWYDGIKRTSNSGMTWENFVPGNTFYNLVTSDGNIYAANYGVFRTSDDGVNWDTLGLLQKNIATIAAGNGNIIAGVYNEGFYSSSDQGKNWTLQNDGLGSIPNNVSNIIINKGIVFASVDGNSIWKRSIRNLVDVNDKNIDAPVSYTLHQNYPNPFNPSTTFSFDLSERSFVKLEVFDLLGKKIDSVISEELPAGKHSAYWNAGKFTSGVYFYRLSAGQFSETKKLILMR